MSADEAINLPTPARLGKQAFLGNSQFIGASPAFLAATRSIERIALCDATVLIQGETGTGKELAARAVHYLSARNSSPFVPVNCGAIPESLFESELFGYTKGAFTDAKGTKLGLVTHADKGTLFLDEIESLSHRGQVALLRFLQDQTYRPVGGQIQTANVRIVAASNQDLLELSHSGEFRSDLYYRLALLLLYIPPLRERIGDPLVLAEHFIHAACNRFGIPPKTLSAVAADWISKYRWPGNVRELENFIYRQMLLSDKAEIGIDFDKPEVQIDNRRHGTDRRQAAWFKNTFQSAKELVIGEFERQYLQNLLTLAKGNIAAAARMAGKERRSFGRLLQKNGIDKIQFRE